MAMFLLLVLAKWEIIDLLSSQFYGSTPPIFIKRLRGPCYVAFDHLVIICSLLSPRTLLAEAVRNLTFSRRDPPNVTEICRESFASVKAAGCSASRYDVDRV